MKRTIIIIALVILACIFLVAILWQPWKNASETLTGTNTSPVRLDCNADYEQNGVQVKSLGCPVDDDKDGFIDENLFVVEATNQTGSGKYLKYFEGSDGDREYLKIEPNSLAQVSVDFGDGNYGLDQLDSFYRESLVVSELELGNVQEQEVINLECKDVERGILPFAVALDERDVFGWEIELRCDYRELDDGSLELDRSQLRGQLEARGRRILVYELPNEHGDTIVYQKESGLGFVFLNTESITVTAYISK